MIDNNVQLAHQFFDALQNGDQKAMAGSLGDGATLWHNYDQIEMPFEAIVPGLVKVQALVHDFAYKNRKYASLADGALLQHSLSGTLADGRRLDVPMMVRIYIRDGKIVRFEEYLDSAAIAPLVSVLTRG